MKKKPEPRDITFHAIGVVHSPWNEPAGVPIQGVHAEGARGTVEVYPEFSKGLKDLDGFSHIMLLFFFDRSRGCSLMCRPFLDTQERGVFATRAPRRPNAIGLSVVRLLDIDDCVLHIRDVDMVDGTPLLDIKPFIPDFDTRSNVRAGWYEHVRNTQQTRADGRFVATVKGEKEEP